jgi:endo-beta-N-acetylglucosaminidase D
MILFVSYLTEEMRKINEKRGYPPNMINIVWYDSVTQEGKLDWQNALNDKNKDLFLASDAIFLNYTWKKEDLEISIEIANRLKDISKIFVGIDVFGRGCFGGGGFNTDLAIREIDSVSRDLSIALFAPGWVYEVLGSEDFSKNNQKFWKKLCLPTKHYPIGPPIVTFFCPGFGEKKFRKGVVICDKTWFDLSKQQIQPNAHHEYNLKYAYEGGGCLSIKGSREAADREIDEAKGMSQGDEGPRASRQSIMTFFVETESHDSFDLFISIVFKIIGVSSENASLTFDFSDADWNFTCIA